MSGLRRPLVLPRPTYYDSTSDYHSIDDSLNRVEYFSNAVLEDQYDAALRSRGRDDALLRNANATIVSAEYQPPHRSVSRRVRASTAPPAPRPSQQEGVYYRPVVSTSGLHASRPPMPNSRRIQYPSRELPIATYVPPAPKTSVVKTAVRPLSIPDPSIGHIDEEVSAEDAKNMGGTVNIPRYYACGGDPLNRPVTELRRKMRRMVAQGKRNPNYYRMGLDD